MVLLLIGKSCTRYNPSFYPSYHVLNPSEAVRRNPLAIITVRVILDPEGNKTYDLKLVTDQELQDGKSYLLVDENFMQHYEELKLTIKEIR